MEFTEEELVIGRLIFKLRLISEANLYPVWGVEDEGSDDKVRREVGSEAREEDLGGQEVQLEHLAHSVLDRGRLRHVTEVPGRLVHAWG